MTRPRVAVDIVTGFLGSGKTTLLRGLLASAPARERIAVIVNEIGEIGIDGRVLSGFDFLENVVELSDGCICCSIDEYRFDFAIDELRRRLDPTLIVIETTGVADPAPAIERVRRCGLGLDAVITVVDALSWTRAWRVSGAARRQIEAADFLVMSKLDLVDSRARARLESKLRRLAPRAVVLAVDHGALATDVLLATSVRRCRDGQRSDNDLSESDARERHLGGSRADRGQRSDADVSASDARGSHLGGSRADRGQVTDRNAAAAGLAVAPAHLAEDGVESFAVRGEEALDRPRFEAFLAALPGAVWRAKGLVNFAEGGGAHLFNFTCGRFELAVLPVAPGLSARSGLPDGSGPSDQSAAPGSAAGPALQAVFIGAHLLGLRESIQSGLDSCRARPQHELSETRARGRLRG
ncbi:MAG: GTP-binding protein [Deltaproteobacteria bacterium]|nr:GTP-binding protein [Deltaproteobacteria bacterium]